MSNPIWQALLHARLHDPPEKALVLMRTGKSHEAGTTRTLLNDIFREGVPAAVAKASKTADHWSSAADRAAFPNHDEEGRYPAWQTIKFVEKPVLLHPLTGEQYDLGKLRDIEAADAENMGTRHLLGLVHTDPKGAIDFQKTALAFWRFGPEIKNDNLKNLWPLLPADSRVPDHTIFDHLDLTAAFAGAFVADPDDGPALLAVSLGPVQGFISAARSTSDLWAGSHLLSRLAWEAMKVVCKECGPEAVLFPRLRGIAEVDRWLCDDGGLRAELFVGAAWRNKGTDENPLFRAALPNRFTALVPANKARALAERITAAVRDFAVKTANAGMELLLGAAGIPADPNLPCYAQIREQLKGFPEVHWAAVPWSLVGTDANGKVDASNPRLKDAMRPFFEGDGAPGYLATKAWKLLSGGLQIDKGWFWKPNPGTLYPALHELLERVLAAAKSERHFDALSQKGWRCSLTGESEWLTTDREQLKTSYRQRSDTLWARVAKAEPSWVKGREKNGKVTGAEHLGALAMLKRMWPVLFVRELRDVLEKDVRRFVVSTHSLALAGTLSGWINRDRKFADEAAARRLREAVKNAPGGMPLPKKLADELSKNNLHWMRKLPGWLDEQAELATDEHAERSATRDLEKALGVPLERYYGLLLMDGDNMGAWLSATAKDFTLLHEGSFSPTIRSALQNRFQGDEQFREYEKELRPPSPSRHMAISDALNNFALHLAPKIVESMHAGKLIYAGGDDVLAMSTVDDLLPMMAMLRAAYSGEKAQRYGWLGDDAIEYLGRGFAKIPKDRVRRVMGDRATASTGAVIAHHQAPLAAVRRELHAAEKRAKALAGKNAFSLTVIKRSGGALRFTAPWGEALRLLLEARDFLRNPKVSRRAVYNSMMWLKDLPEGDPGMLEKLLGYQFERQGGDGKASSKLAQQLVKCASEHGASFADSENSSRWQAPHQWLSNLLQIAEFLARESRGVFESGAEKSEKAA
ncbi:MAG: type III-B CRISPR-associated protein Cas10/Cmr2 [Xanthomonadales bacterium]|nr:type III-B CRISPR-associated protein Cas10/Cmr2 [Xanthomonadales bacterium]